VKLGILSDIHESVELLEKALAVLALEGVDRFIVLGDVFETGPRMCETVRLLEGAGAIGVFGNHDFGLSIEPSEYILERFPPAVLAYMGKLLPRLEIDDSLFSHREPWLDCSEVAEIWHVDEEPLTPEALARSFDAVPHRSIFIGHFHSWMAFTREGQLPWEGDSPLALPVDGPTLVVVGAVCDGHTAIFETTTRVLTPLDLYAGTRRPDRRPLPPLVSG
jgi:hypothetical protein